MLQYSYRVYRHKRCRIYGGRQSSNHRSRLPDLAANGAHPSDIDVANNAIARDKVLYEGHVVAAVAAITVSKPKQLRKPSQ